MRGMWWTLSNLHREAKRLWYFCTVLTQQRRGYKSFCSFLYWQKRTKEQYKEGTNPFLIYPTLFCKTSQQGWSVLLRRPTRRMVPLGCALFFQKNFSEKKRINLFLEKFWEFTRNFFKSSLNGVWGEPLPYNIWANSPPSRRGDSRIARLWRYVPTNGRSKPIPYREWLTSTRRVQFALFLKNTFL